NWKTRPLAADTFDAWLTVTRLKITFRAHVVVDQTQVNVQLLAIENVRALEARDQAGFFHVLHRTAQLAVAEDLVSFKLNVDDANTVAFVDVERDGQRRC